MNGQFRAPLLSLLVLVIASSARGQTAAPPASPGQPPGSRALTGDDKKRAKQLDEQIDRAMRADRWSEAIAAAEELLALRTWVQGGAHFETVNASWQANTLRRAAALPKEERAVLVSARELNDRAESLQEKEAYAEARPLLERALAIRLRLLGRDHPDTATTYNDLAASLDADGKYGDAEPLHRWSLDTWLKALGEGHPDTATGYNNLASNLQHQGKPAEAEPCYRRALAIWLQTSGADHPNAAAGYSNLGLNLDAQGKCAEAEPLLRRALASFLRERRDGGHRTATGYNNLALNLEHQEKYAEAELLFRRALDLFRRTLGEGHPLTARSVNNLAVNLQDQGKYAEAEPLLRRALAIRLEAPDEGHPDTALGYSNLAGNLEHQGRYAEAEPLLRRSLAIWLRALGEGHPDTATGYNNLAVNLQHQGKYTEAEPLLHRALAIQLQTRGADHPDAALGYSNVAANLDAQGKYAEAEPLLRRALAIRLKAPGANQRDAAAGYSNLARNLDVQGKRAEAEPLLRRALAIRLQVLGEDHLDTAAGYSNLAGNLFNQEKYAEAEALDRRALAISLKALGEGHPLMAAGYDNLAHSLDGQGKRDEAIANWSAAAADYDRAWGLLGATGLDRALTADSSPLPALAAALAGRGRSREAWARWEADLARGLLDDLSARLLRPLNPEQRSREADLARQLQRLEERCGRLAATARRTRDEDQQLDALRHQQSELRGRWVEFQNALDRRYQAFAGKPSTLEEIQKALPPGAAMVGWLDMTGHHWACVVQREGDPIWVQIPGSGQGGAWTKEDEGFPGRLRDALADSQLAWRAPAAALARQRLAPMLPHLKGVKHLIVLPSRALAGVPIEALVASDRGADPPSLVVSYAPSGSMFARLTAPRSQALGPPRLLALGDPAFPKSAPRGLAPAPPDHGIPIVAVEPHGVAELFGIKPGDVLLEYNGKVLKTFNDSAVVPAGDKVTRVPIKFWRDGEIRSLEIAAGELGISPSNPDRPVAQVVLAQRAADEILKPAVRGGSLTTLPGTRREVQAIAALFPKDQVTTLLGPEATESNLQRLAASGALKQYRFLLLATHGKPNPDVALSSALFLAGEPERPSGPADLRALESVPDGQITAEQIVRTWDLDAELVVLSACESGLGRYAGGEGYLGFAQALFVKGARSLVLSLWKVDDAATSLLMERFYQNLLGRRPGLASPMPKAEALAEAKCWLRELTAGEIDEDLGRLTRGDTAVAPKSVLVKRRPVATPASIRRYEHPYYWAGFILIGDPD
jgi:CHAT domain-containing protein